MSENAQNDAGAPIHPETVGGPPEAEKTPQELAGVPLQAWLATFEGLVRARHVGFTSDGLWTCAHLWHSQGLSPTEAARRFGNPQYGPRNVRVF